MATDSYWIQIAPDGPAFPCRAREAVFQAMQRARTGPLSVGCCGGGCGVCKMKVLSGRVEIFQPMSRAHISPEEEAQGILLTCCIQPRSNLVLAPLEVNP